MNIPTINYIVQCPGYLSGPRAKYVGQTARFVGFSRLPGFLKIQITSLDKPVKIHWRSDCLLQIPQ
jgi:hypothetical protein